MTAYSGLYNGVFSEDYVLLVNTAPVRRILNKFLRKSRTGSRETAALLIATIGAAAGAATASDSFSRIGSTVDPGNAIVNGGARTIETRTIINRATAAADITAMEDIVNEVSKPSSYPVDLSGNGGGGALTKSYSLG